MQHCGTKKLETERLILRRFSTDDALTMYQNWASDPDVTRFLTWPAHTNQHVTQTVLEDWVRQYQNPAFYQWAIVLKEWGPEPIGSISAVQIDDVQGSAEIGYCIGKPWWHQGITSEALRTIMDFFFEEVGIQQIQARHHPDNSNSGKVMQKAGMICQGVMETRSQSKPGSYQAVLYSKLNTEL